MRVPRKVPQVSPRGIILWVPLMGWGTFGIFVALMAAAAREEVVGWTTLMGSSLVVPGARTVLVGWGTTVSVAFAT